MSSFEEIFNSCVEDLKRGESIDIIKNKICINLIKESTIDDIMDLAKEKVRYDEECGKIHTDAEHYKDVLDLHENVFKSHLTHVDNEIERYVDRCDMSLSHGLHSIENDLENMFRMIYTFH